MYVVELDDKFDLRVYEGVNNDKKVSEVDYSWCEEITVKELMNTSVTEDITSLIYKTNALVKRVDGKDFVNYYLYDIDVKLLEELK